MYRLREAVVIGGWVVLLLTASLGIADATLAPTPTPTRPDFVDTILASRAVVVAIRVAVVFAAIFVALSVVALIARRQWLTRVGPVEVSDRMSELAAEKRRLGERMDIADRAIEGLQESVAHTHRLINQEQTND
jgi:hypothetical protein